MMLRRKETLRRHLASTNETLPIAGCLVFTVLLFVSGCVLAGINLAETDHPGSIAFWILSILMTIFVLFPIREMWITLCRRKTIKKELAQLPNIVSKISPSDEILPDELPEAMIDGVWYRPHPNGGGLVAETAQVDESAFVGFLARVEGTARVLHYAVVKDHAIVRGNAKVVENAEVGGSVIICGNAIVGGRSVVDDRVLVTGNAIVRGFSSVEDDAHICESAVVEGHAFVGDKACISGNSRVGGTTRVVQNSWVSGNTHLASGYYNRVWILSPDDRYPEPPVNVIV